MHLDMCLPCCNDCVLLGLVLAEPVMFLSLHVTCSFIFMHTYLQVSIFLYKLSCCCFYDSLSLSLSLSLALVASWHLNVSLLHPKTLFVLGHLLLLLILPLLLFDFVMRGPVWTSQRTFLDKAFIRNAKSSSQISLTLTYPLLSTIGVGSHCVAPRSLALSRSYKSFTLICTDLILQYLSFLLAFEVHTLWSLRILYPRCFMSRG